MSTSSDAKIEREQVEYVFGLTGGELADEPWTAFHVGHDETRAVDDERARRWGLGPTIYDRRYPHAYWYDGAPEYAEREFSGVTARTIIALGGGYMSAPSPGLVDESGVWALAESYTSSGETECPGRHEDAGAQVRPDQCGDGDRCVLCEALCITDLATYRKAQGEYEDGNHGHIYIGEGYEAVYVLAVHDCRECGEPIHCTAPERFRAESCGCETEHAECRSGRDDDAHA